MTQATKTCNQCYLAQKRKDAIDCPMGDAHAMCAKHADEHAAKDHPGTNVHMEAIVRIMQREMLDGYITGFYTPEISLSLKGSMPNTWAKSTFLTIGQELLEFPCIATVQLPKGDREAMVKRTVSAVAASGLQIYHYTIRSSITLMCGLPSDLRFVGNTDVPMEEQLSATGVVIDPEADGDKVAKRFGIFCIAEGAGAINIPSSGDTLNLGEGITAKVAVHDTGDAGDGMAAARMSLAKEWLKASGITGRLSKIFAFYAQVITKDYYFKGVVVVHRDHEYPGPEGSDIVFDKASLSRQVLSDGWTFYKILPIRVSDDDSGMTQIEYLMQGETFTAFTDPKETAPKMFDTAKVLDSRFYRQARKAHRDNLENEKTRIDGYMTFDIEDLDNETLYWEVQPDEANVHLSRAKSRSDSDRMVNIALAASHQSPFVNPHGTSRLIGKLAATWRSKKLRPKRGKNTTLPMLMVAGREVTLAHWYYAGVPEPPPGYLRLVWRHNKPVMAVPNELDFHSRNRAMDTWDNDSDKLTLAWMIDEEQHGALTLRRPMSVDGGTWMNLLDEDVEKLERLGDGWNQKTGDHRWEGLYDVDKEGNPLRPSVVKPEPFESKDSWNSNLRDPAEVLTFLMERNKYAGAIGMASNYAANLDMASAFDPDRHLFCLSEDVIDGTGIPENLLQHLRMELYQTARSGTAMCPCVWPRVAGEMNRLHREQTDDSWANLTVRTKCPEHHGLYHQWSAQAVEYLEDRLHLRQLCSNGPLNRLTQEHDELLTAVVREAFAKRNAAWRKCVSTEESLKQEADTPDFVRESLRAKAIEDAHRTELEAANQAYAKARELPGYQLGDFTNVWYQLELNCRRRFKKGSLPAPITIMALSKLPDEEHLAFYASGPSVATAIVRTMEAPREARLKGVKPGARFTVLKDGSNWYWLCRPDGTKVTRIRADAKAYLHMQLEAVGFLPDFQAPECNQVQLPPDQDEGPSHTLALKLLGA